MKLLSPEHIKKTHWPNRYRDALLAQKTLLEYGEPTIKAKIAIHCEEMEAGKASQAVDIKGDIKTENSNIDITALSPEDIAEAKKLIDKVFYGKKGD
jgi:hypothetical protein